MSAASFTSTINEFCHMHYHCNFKARFYFHIHPELSSGLLILYDMAYFSLQMGTCDPHYLNQLQLIRFCQFISSCLHVPRWRLHSDKQLVSELQEN